MWRPAVTTLLLGAMGVGLGYAHNQDSKAPPFLTAPVERGTISTLVKATGSVDAKITVDVSSQLSGRIAEVFVNFNDVVRRANRSLSWTKKVFSLPSKKQKPRFR